MQIFVRTPNSTVVIVECQPTDSVESIQQQFVGCDRLVFGAKTLECGQDLASYGIEKESTVYAIGDVCGGKKKKKKKKMIKGKQMKKGHKHKNVRLRVLKYFKVEGDGEGEEYKVTRTKQECPHPDCGAGVFMAAHADRSTCGKCSLTYVKDQAAGKKK